MKSLFVLVSLSFLSGSFFKKHNEKNQGRIKVQVIVSGLIPE